ncbi:unnamed protein product, partial [Adineta steineri]
EILNKMGNLGSRI